ncbi:MAG TPA: GFA family protein [Lysobacter sp.]
MKTGSCHCGAVRFNVRGEIDQAIECNCSHCSRKGFLLWFVPRDALAISAGDERLTTYTFNRHVIQHRFCPTCGVQPFGLGRMPDGSEMAAINIRCLDDVDLGVVPRVPVNGREF